MLFGNGLSALMTLLGISAALVVVVRDRPAGRRRPADAPGRAAGWRGWSYFGALGAGFMLIEVSVLQRFVLLLGHPVYSLTVTLFSLLLGTGLGAAWSRRLRPGDAPSQRRARHRRGRTDRRRRSPVVAAPIVDLGDSLPAQRPDADRGGDARADRQSRWASRCRPACGCSAPRAPEMVAWAWGINGALSVLGATLAIFIAMNWGFRVTLLTAAVTYLIGLAALLVATRASGVGFGHAV